MERSAIERAVFTKTIGVLQNLVAFNTTSRPDGKSESNLPLLDYARGLLWDSGIDSEYASNPGDKGKRANLIARIGPEAPGGILLSGHTDVVSVDGQNWSADPWQLRFENGWFYGRGTADMKAFIACALVMAKRWAKSNLKEPIYLVFSYDEEIGCIGIRSAAELLAQRGITPRIVMVGEPTEHAVVEAHKSRVRIHLDCVGSGGHASKIDSPLITNPIDFASVAYVEMMKHRGTIGTALGNNLVGAASFTNTAPGLLGSLNIIPETYSPFFDMRARPGITAEEVHAVLQPHIHHASEICNHGKEKPGTINSRELVSNRGHVCNDEETIRLAMHLANTKRRETADYVTEAPRFGEAGLDDNKVVICGPGSILVAHQPNERIHMLQIAKCLSMMQRVGHLAMAPG